MKKDNSNLSVLYVIVHLMLTGWVGLDSICYVSSKSTILDTDLYVSFVVLFIFSILYFPLSKHKIIVIE